MYGIRALPGRAAYPFIEQTYSHQLEMVRHSSLGLVVAPSLPNGYALRQLRSGDEGPYDDLFHLAFADEGRYAETVGRALDGGFFVIEHLLRVILWHPVWPCAAVVHRVTLTDKWVGWSLIRHTRERAWERSSVQR